MTGHIELPAGSGLWFATDGTLATHPQGELLRVRVKDVTGRALVDDMPIVIDHFVPRGMAYVLEDMICVNRAGEKIEQAWAARPGNIRLTGLLGWVTTRVDPLGLGRACAHSAITKDCPECAAADLVLKSSKEYETKFLADVEGDRAAEAEHITERRRVAVTDLPNGDHISTVLLHSHLADGGDPDAYETLVTRGPHEGMCERHATRREAERAHRVMVDMLSADE